MLNDINSREDIERLIKAFYVKMLDDIVIGFIFTQIAKVDLDEHLPIICDFWESLLFNKPVYRRGSKVMEVHHEINKKIVLKKGHFTRWLYLFHTTVDELFEGERANRAKERAVSIADTIQKRLATSDCSNKPGLEVKVL